MLEAGEAQKPCRSLANHDFRFWSPGAFVYWYSERLGRQHVVARAMALWEIHHFGVGVGVRFSVAHLHWQASNYDR